MAGPRDSITGLLVKIRAGSEAGFAAAGAVGAFEPIMEVPPGPVEGLGLAASAPALWARADAGDNAWDRAHALIAGGFAADGSGVLAAEPDFEQQWSAAGNATACVAEPQTRRHGRAVGPGYAWHLDDAFSGLRSARAEVPAADQAQVTVAHLDTGYDPQHAARPRSVWAERQRNFVRGDAEDPNSAVDTTTPGTLRNPGHGTGTIGILAGGDPGPQPDGVTGPLGGAPGVRVLPIRIANSVVRFTTGTMVQGFDHARRCGVDVVSMSMGGRASAALADAVNLCYEDGIVLVTAAGNFVEAGGVISSPRSIVYPARMRRVLAATGVMADGRPYFGHGLSGMQGCHGPAGKMDTALAGWTPNIPWPERGCGTVIDLDGQGTSAATPQVAAAAALWIARHRRQLAAYPEKWMKGEAARQALMAAARKTTAVLDAGQVREALGAGSVDALAALAVAPLPARQLRRAPVASAAWDWLRLLTGRGVGLARELASPREQMLGLEVMHVVHANPELEGLLADSDAGPSGARQRRRFLEGVREAPGVSRTLRAAIDRALGVGARSGGLPVVAMPRSQQAAPERRRMGTASRGEQEPPTPRDRRLRIFALDPSLGGSLALVDSKVATVNVRYEHDRRGASTLLPGPVGEYLEVVDVDPASNQFYPPVDLDDPRLLLQDGLAPSAGNPQFHQQMVYAVAMRTITSFEDALGRDALWPHHRRPKGHPLGEGYEYVHRLRLYPHALRAKNAYYSPNRGALLFGYFPAARQARGPLAPGTLVFSCLSADIIAHEMTHALLDGYTPGYKERSNPDVAAFHEAFADIVALFQHFQYVDLVRREIAGARGKLGAASLLGGLAREFGHGADKKGPLRDYVRPNGELDYAKTMESHDRGSLLVAAIYRAFIAIFERRTGDLIRLATGGTGLLGEGAIHPDLVERLTSEACKIAGHVLRMCIRALDYLPPYDITFGAYLRALITADVEQIQDDRYHYRTALIESFREFGLLPTNLRTMSVETLLWNRPPQPQPAWLAEAVGKLKIDWHQSLSRWDIYQLQAQRCRELHGVLHRHIVACAKAGRSEVCDQLALAFGLPRYDEDTGREVAQARRNGTTVEVRNVRVARRLRPDGRLSDQIHVVLAQRRPEPLDGRDIANGFFWHRGGATMVIDPSNEANEPEIRYFIWKRLGDPERLQREREYRGVPSADLRAMYFGERGVAGDEPFAVLHAKEY